MKEYDTKPSYGRAAVIAKLVAHCRKCCDGHVCTNHDHDNHDLLTAQVEQLGRDNEGLTEDLERARLDHDAVVQLSF